MTNTKLKVYVLVEEAMNACDIVGVVFKKHEAKRWEGPSPRNGYWRGFYEFQANLYLGGG